MVTIYLDKQVFSYLFKASNEKYDALREKILSHGPAWLVGSLDVACGGKRGVPS